MGDWCDVRRGCMSRLFMVERRDLYGNVLTDFGVVLDKSLYDANDLIDRMHLELLNK